MKATVTGPGKDFLLVNLWLSKRKNFILDGSEVPCRVTKVNSTTYECSYVPNRAGPYTVNVTYGGAHIPKSPFPVSVGPFKDSRIQAYGPGLEGGVVSFPADFVVETNGETGSLGM